MESLFFIVIFFSIFRHLASLIHCESHLHVSALFQGLPSAMRRINCHTLGAAEATGDTASRANSFKERQPVQETETPVNVWSQQRNLIIYQNVDAGPKYCWLQILKYCITSNFNTKSIDCHTKVSHPPSQAMPLLARFQTRAPPPTRLHNPSPSHSQKQDRIPVRCLRAHLQLWPGGCRWVVVCLSCRHPFCKGATKGCCSLRDLHSFWLAISWKTSTFIVHTPWLD